jgi:hypothetical protein
MNTKFTNRLAAAYALLIEAAEAAEKNTASGKEAAKQSAPVTADPEANELIRSGHRASVAGNSQLGEGK